MKKRFLTLACIMMIFLCACGTGSDPASSGENSSSESSSQESSQSSSSRDENAPIFRNVRWGMSKEEVIASETYDPAFNLEGSKTLTYDDIWICGRRTVLGYSFGENDQLNNCMFFPADSHSSVALYVKDYEAYKAGLTEKYGTPTSDEQTWLDRTFENDPNYALSIGELEYLTQWDLEDTKILCSLRGDNYEITCGVVMYAKEFEGPVDNGL